MSFTEKELKKQSSEVRSKVLIIFIPIAILIAVISLYQNTSTSHNKKKYQESQAIEFNGRIIKKKQEGNYSRSTKYIVLENYHDERITNEIYYKINIGDSVIKRKGEDTVYFFLKNGEKLFMDYNKYTREKYLETLHKKN